MSAKVLKPLGSTQGLGTLVKARFGAGMLLQHDDLDTLADYTQELNRLLFRSLFGCGVVCGLVVSVDPPKCGKLLVRVAKGVALDSCGDPIAVNTTQTIPLDTQCDPNFPDTLWVVLCAKYKCCAPRMSMCADDDSDDPPAVATRVRYGYEIRVVATRPECACGCSVGAKLHDSPCRCVNPDQACYSEHYDGQCSGCGCTGDCGGDCGCDCVVLAQLDRVADAQGVERWAVTHHVRRFIRPVLIEDPQVRLEFEARNKQAEAAAGQAEEAVKRADLVSAAAAGPASKRSASKARQAAKGR